VLTGLGALKLCIAYEHKGERLNNIPARLSTLEDCSPVYEQMEGWHEDISGARAFEQLPKNAQSYVKKIEEFVGVPVSIISVGSGRDETIICHNPFATS
jgi:adenylosuccinate synthase